MRYCLQLVESKASLAAASMVFVGGLCLSAYAQLPAPSLPSLPAPVIDSSVIPPVVGASATLPEINLPSLPNIDNNKLDGAELSGMAMEKANAIAPVLPPLPPVVKDDTGAVSAMPDLPPPIGGKQVLPAAAVAPMVPEVTVNAKLPVAPEPADLAGDQLSLPLPGQPNMEEPEASKAIVEQEDKDQKLFAKDLEGRAQPKSWQTKLIPQVSPVKTDFNYKRQILPLQISRTEYSKDNRHLPPRMMREDYVTLLFTSVAKNDLEGARALLNAGTSLSATNRYGETPLQFARRLGASNVAALLEARGAQH